MSTKKVRMDRSPIVPERVRVIGGQGFAFIPHHFLRRGFFAALCPDELLLYFLLVLVGNRYGVSFYGQDKLGSLLQMPWHTYLNARNALIAKDLIAFDGLRFQVLSLPARPTIQMTKTLTCAQQFERDDPATVRQLIRRSLGEAMGQQER